MLKWICSSDSLQIHQETAEQQISSGALQNLFYSYSKAVELTSRKLHHLKRGTVSWLIHQQTYTHV